LKRRKKGRTLFLEKRKFEIRKGRGGGENNGKRKSLTQSNLKRKTSEIRGGLRGALCYVHTAMGKKKGGGRDQGPLERKDE